MITSAFSDARHWVNSSGGLLRLVSPQEGDYNTVFMSSLDFTDISRSDSLASHGGRTQRAAGIVVGVHREKDG